jgi:hypothetical protein
LNVLAGPVIAGMPITLVITARDEFGNPNMNALMGSLTAQFPVDESA